MGKISLQDLASVLVERWHLGKKEASMFVNEMFFVIQKSLDEDKIVKVKGLGTFKIIDVDDRESVDVNTGDRVLIEGHGKITFTPDALMKELVNKPFSQFETVVLNEGVDFNDATANQPEETTGDVLDEIEDSSAPLVEFVDESHDEKSVELESPKPEPVAVADLPKEEETATEDISEEITESDASHETPQEVSEEASEGIEETEGTGESEETEENVVIEDLEEGPGFKKYLKWIGLVLLALAVFLIGYLAGRGPKTTPQEPKTEIVKNDTVKNLPNDSDTVDMQTEVEEESLEDEEVADDDEETMEDEEEAKEEERPLDKWEAMDARVKTGAYRIIGTDTVVKAKAGDNLTRIGNRLLGPGMECYLEVYNGLSAGAVLSAGQEIKIPKVELKKKKRKIE
jgi:nucleoid DNA-binding protein